MLADVIATSQEPPSRVLIASKTRSIIDKPQILATMTFSDTVFTMEIQTPTSPIISTGS
jgi:hypothetical protein